MDYANRDNEYTAITSYIETGKSPIFIYAYHASGVTSFVKKRMEDVFSTMYGSNIFYIDAVTGKSFSEMLLSCMVCSEHADELQRFADKAFGENNNTILTSALEGIPYAGPLLGRLVERRSAIPIYSGVYSSAMDEILLQFFHETEQRFLIIIDAVENLPELSYDILTKLLKCHSMQCILIRTEQNLQYNKLENYLFENKIDLSSCVDFDRPKVKLIKELGAIYGISVSSNEAASIIANNNQNIHAIIKEIRNLKNKSRYDSLDAWEKAIISVLNIWEVPIDENILHELIEMSEVFTLNEDAELQNALSKLQKRELIEHTSQGWHLKGYHDPQIQIVLSNFGDQLYYKNIIYEFLSKQSNETRYVELCYRLSKNLNCTTPADAKAYMRQCIISGKEISQSLMEDACLEKGNRSDCLLASIKYSRERRYQNAFDWIDSIPDKQMTADMEAYRASLLNRVRKGKEAEEALLQCLQQNSDPAQHNLLSAFLISTYIHMEKLHEAQTVYNEKKDLFPDSPMHGYLVRNATSAFKEYREDLYERALSDFQYEQDNFGYYTTLCNQGYALCKTKNYKSALYVLEQAQEGMELFPQVNLHIIYNNLGICHFLLEQYQDAYRYLYLAQRLGQNSMPRIFSTINLACVEAVTGNTERAIQNLDVIEQEVKNHKLDRVRQKYYVNRLLIEYLNGERNIKPLIDKCLAYPDRYFPEQTAFCARFYQEFMNSDNPVQKTFWHDLYSPCGLAYWYMDPLKFLSKSFI